MTNSKLAIIGGSGLYEIEGLKILSGKKSKLHGDIPQIQY